MSVKLAILLHGTGGSDTDYFWFADTKQFLENHGYSVWLPLLPNTEKPNLQESMAFLESHMPALDEDSILIAHSSACPLVLTYLEKHTPHVKQVVLVAGFYESIDDEGFSALMLQADEYSWGAIRNTAKEIILINADNDPWGCDDTQAKPVAEKLGATFILAAGQGHMGSGTFDQPYREHEIVKGELDI